MWTRVFEWRLNYELIDTLIVEPMATEGPLRHHVLEVLVSFLEVRHKLLATRQALCCGKEPHEVVCKVIDRVIDLWLCC